MRHHRTATVRRPHPRSGIQALLIDALGTLVALRPPAPALALELSLRFGLEVSEPDAGRALAAEIAFYRAHMALGRDNDSLQALRRRCAEVLRDALGPASRAALADLDATTTTLLAALQFEAFDDARPLLLRARSEGLRVVAVSNWDVSLIEVLERVGLAPLLDGVVSSAAVGAAKPDPAIFAHALALAGVHPRHALHVGDSLSEDVQGARGCGIDSVLLRRGGEAPGLTPGVRTISSLADLTLI